MSHPRMNKRSVLQLAQLALLAALSILLVMLHFPLIPAAPFLEYDMADVPILLGTLLYGTQPGLLILAVVSLVQAFFFGGNGWVGCVMHFVASGALVVLVGEIYRRKPSLSRLIVGMAAGAAAMTLLMIPMNLLLTTWFLGTPRDVVVSMLVPAIIPFNLLKGVINCVITAVLFQALQPFLRKYGYILGRSPR